MSRSLAVTLVAVSAFAAPALAQKAAAPAPAAKTTAAPAAAPAAKTAAAPAAKTTAAPATAPAEMGPPKAGPEVKALAALVGNFTSVGQLAAGAMGPGSPAAPTKGSEKCKWIDNGLWADCEIVDVAGSGKTAMTWSGRFYMGWDVEAKAYVMTGVDNFGTAYTLHGNIVGHDIIWESAPQMAMGKLTKFRFTYDVADPKLIKFSDERSVEGGAWATGETVTMKKGL